MTKLNIAFLVLSLAKYVVLNEETIPDANITTRPFLNNVDYNILQKQLAVLVEQAFRLEKRSEQLKVKMGNFHNLSFPLDNSHNHKGHQGQAMPEHVRVNFFRDCSEIYSAGYVDNGVYDIWLVSGFRFVQIFCDMETQGEFSGKKGWMTIQKRTHGNVNFDRRWPDYVKGFGYLDSEHWIGLETIYWLLRQQQYVESNSVTLALRIDVEDWDGIRAFVEYKEFNIAPSSRGYRIIRLGGSRGQTFVDRAFSFGMSVPFSTSDQNTDNRRSRQCLEEQQGGWWFGGCNFMNLNGDYSVKRTTMSKSKIFIRNWDRVNAANTAIRYSSMKLQ